MTLTKENILQTEHDLINEMIQFIWEEEDDSKYFKDVIYYISGVTELSDNLLEIINKTESDKNKDTKNIFPVL